MQQQDFDIEVRANGEVKVHMKGVKGKGCLEYSALFEDLIGEIKDQTLTSEHYEPDGKVGIHVEQRQRRG